MDARKLKDNAAEYFRKGRFSKAAEAYLALAKIEPRETQHLIKLGDAYRRDGRREEAIETYRRAVDDYARQGVVIKAIAACKLILEIDPNQKAAQEALADLCAQRYVRRPASDQQEVAATRPAGRYIEPIELPEEDSAPFGAIETAGGDLLPEPQPEPRQVMTRPAPLARSIEEVIERNEADRPSVAFHAPIDLVELAGSAVEPIPDRLPTALELDLGLGGAGHHTRKSAASVPAWDDSDDGVEILDPADVLEELEPEEENAGGFAITAETTGEQQVLRDVERLLAQPTTAMAALLASSVPTGSGSDDEIELLTVSTGSGSASTSSEPGEALELDLVALPSSLAPSPVEHTPDEQREGMRLANEAAFDPSDDLVLQMQEELARERDAASAAAAAPAAPVGEVTQSSVPLFSELPREAFVELLERLTFRRFSAGEVILREGDPGRSIFVLASGRARVVKGLGTQEPIELAVLEDGAFFGEMALLNGAPRVASVVADDDCEVLELTENVLRALALRHPSVTQSLNRFYRQRLLQNVMSMSPLFRAFDRGDRRSLVERFRLRQAKVNETILREGQGADGLYVVMHGTALVTKTDEATGRAVPLAVLKEGDVFGEMSLLTKQPVSATVTTRRRSLLLRLPKAAFDEVMFTHPAVLELVSELTDQRTKTNEQILSGQAPSPREALATL